MLRTARLTTLFCALFAFSSCAWILHPERRGQTAHGAIDGVPLIIDIVWFIPGLIPGIVCLAVDFASGAIYTSGSGTTKILVRHNGKVIVRRAPVESATLARVALIDAEGKVLAEDSAVWSPDHHSRKDKLEVQIPRELRHAASANSDLHVEVQLGDAEPTIFGLELVDGQNAG